MRRFLRWLQRFVGADFLERAKAEIKAEEDAAARHAIVRTNLNSDH